MLNALALEQRLGRGPAEWQRSLPEARGSLLALLGTPPDSARPAASAAPEAGRATAVGASASGGMAASGAAACGAAASGAAATGAAASGRAVDGRAVAEGGAALAGGATVAGGAAARRQETATAGGASPSVLTLLRASPPAQVAPAASVSASPAVAPLAAPFSALTAAEEARQWAERARLYNGLAPPPQPARPPKRPRHAGTKQQAPPAGQRALTSFFG